MVIFQLLLLDPIVISVSLLTYTCVQTNPIWCINQISHLFCLKDKGTCNQCHHHIRKQHRASAAKAQIGC